MAKKATYRFNNEMDKWLEDEAKKKGTTKNDVLRGLIYEAMRLKTSDETSISQTKERFS